MGARNWSFRLDDYNDNDLDNLRNIVGEKVCYLLYRVGNKDTPNAQMVGFLTCEKKTRLNALRSILGDKFHLECCRKVKETQAYLKSGDWNEFGSRSKINKVSEMESFKASVKGGMRSMKEVRERYSTLYAQYPNFCIEYINDYHQDDCLP